jgi:hypothetical protein
MNIRSSLDWNNIDSNLRHIVNTKVDTAENKYQLYRMIDNISAEVTLLSKAEVLARRGNKREAAYLLEKINTDIESIEEFILVAALIG